MVRRACPPFLFLPPRSPDEAKRNPGAALLLAQATRPNGAKRHRGTASPRHAADPLLRSAPSAPRKLLCIRKTVFTVRQPTLRRPVGPLPAASPPRPRRTGLRLKRIPRHEPEGAERREAQVRIAAP